MTHTRTEKETVMTERVKLNTDPPRVRCGMCGGRCRPWGLGWIECRRCCWASFDPDRVGWLWRLRVWIGR